MYNDLIGKKFKYHGRGPDEYDCLGLAIEVLQRNGINMMDFQTYKGNFRSVAETITNAKLVENCVKISKPEKLSIVTFKIVSDFVSHIGIVIDNYLSFIHILEGTHVTIEKLHHPTWIRKIEGYYKWIH